MLSATFSITNILIKMSAQKCNTFLCAGRRVLDVNMERYVVLFKRHVINFKLELCCFMATVRSGLLAFACLHIAIGMLTLMFFAEKSFEPLLLKVFKSINGSPPNYELTCMIVYAVELGSNVLLLCGIIRNDQVLLRVYMYFSLAVLTAALMVYSVMFSTQNISIKFLIVVSISHQIYILLLMRSLMVDLKQASKRNGYAVNYRKSSLRYSRSGSRDRYSVVIEPHRPRLSLVPVVVKERNIPKITKDDDKEHAPEGTAIIHTPVKEDVYNETVVKVGVDEGTDKEGKGVTKESKGKEVKRRRNIFGRKEKVKTHESQVTKEA